MPQCLRELGHVASKENAAGESGITLNRPICDAWRLSERGQNQIAAEAGVRPQSAQWERVTCPCCGPPSATLAIEGASRIRLRRSGSMRPSSALQSTHDQTAASLDRKPLRAMMPRSTAAQFPGDSSSAFMGHPIGAGHGANSRCASMRRNVPHFCLSH